MTTKINSAAAQRVTAAVTALLISDLPLMNDTADRTEILTQELADLQQHLRSDYPALKLHLITHVEPFDRSRSHDVIIRGLGRAISVGVAGSPLLPWPVRGVLRPTELMVLRVNDLQIPMDEAIHVLDEALDDPGLLRTLVHAALARQAFWEFGITLTRSQLQDATDAYRRAKGLYTTEQTERWLDRQQLSADQLAQLAGRAARLDQLRAKVTSAIIESAFAERRKDYAILSIAVIDLAGRDRSELAQKLAADPLAVVISAQAMGAAASVRSWRVNALPAGLHDLAEAPERIPQQVDLATGPGLAVVLKRTEASLDQSTRQAVENDLFYEWLEDRRRSADVEWYWGQAHHTDRLTEVVQ